MTSAPPPSNQVLCIERCFAQDHGGRCDCKQPTKRERAIVPDHRRPNWALATPSSAKRKSMARFAR